MKMLPTGRLAYIPRRRLVLAPVSAQRQRHPPPLHHRARDEHGGRYPPVGDPGRTVQVLHFCPPDPNPCNSIQEECNESQRQRLPPESGHLRGLGATGGRDRLLQRWPTRRRRRPVHAVRPARNGRLREPLELRGHLPDRSPRHHADLLRELRRGRALLRRHPLPGADSSGRPRGRRTPPATMQPRPPRSPSGRWGRPSPSRESSAPATATSTCSRIRAPASSRGSTPTATTTTRRGAQHHRHLRRHLPRRKLPARRDLGPEPEPDRKQRRPGGGDRGRDPVLRHGRRLQRHEQQRRRWSPGRNRL